MKLFKNKLLSLLILLSSFSQLAKAEEKSEHEPEYYPESVLMYHEKLDLKTNQITVTKYPETLKENNPRQERRTVENDWRTLTPEEIALLPGYQQDLVYQWRAQEKQAQERAAHALNQGKIQVHTILAAPAVVPSTNSLEAAITPLATSTSSNSLDEIERALEETGHLSAPEVIPESHPEIAPDVSKLGESQVLPPQQDVTEALEFFNQPEPASEKDTEISGGKSTTSAEIHADLHELLEKLESDKSPTETTLSHIDESNTSTNLEKQVSNEKSQKKNTHVKGQADLMELLDLLEAEDSQRLQEDVLPSNTVSQVIHDTSPAGAVTNAPVSKGEASVNMSSEELTTLEKTTERAVPASIGNIPVVQVQAETTNRVEKAISEDFSPVQQDAAKASPDLEQPVTTLQSAEKTSPKKSSYHGKGQADLMQMLDDMGLLCPEEEQQDAVETNVVQQAVSTIQSAPSSSDKPTLHQQVLNLLAEEKASHTTTPTQPAPKKAQARAGIQQDLLDLLNDADSMTAKETPKKPPYNTEMPFISVCLLGLASLGAGIYKRLAPKHKKETKPSLSTLQTTPQELSNAPVKANAQPIPSVSKEPAPQKAQTEKEAPRLIDTLFGKDTVILTQKEVEAAPEKRAVLAEQLLGLKEIHEINTERAALKKMMAKAKRKNDTHLIEQIQQRRQELSEKRKKASARIMGPEMMAIKEERRLLTKKMTLAKRAKDIDTQEVIQAQRYSMREKLKLMTQEVNHFDYLRQRASYLKVRARE